MELISTELCLFYSRESHPDEPHASFVFAAVDLAQPIQGTPGHGWRTTHRVVWWLNIISGWIYQTLSIYLSDGFCIKRKKNQNKILYVDCTLPYGEKIPIVLLFLLMEQGVTSVGRGPINPWFQLSTLLFTLLNSIELCFLRPEVFSLQHCASYSLIFPLQCCTHECWTPHPNQSCVSCCMLAMIQRTAPRNQHQRFRTFPC